MTDDLGGIKAQPLSGLGGGSESPPTPELPMWSPEVFIGPKLQLSVCLPTFLLPSSLSLSTQASVMAYHRLGGLNNRNLLSHSPRGWKFKIKEGPGWFGFLVLGSLFLAYRQPPTHCILTWSFLCAYAERSQESALVSSSSPDNTSPIKSESRLWLCMCCALLSHFSHIQLFATPWTVTHQAPLSMGFSRLEYWSG